MHGRIGRRVKNKGGAHRREPVDDANPYPPKPTTGNEDVRNHCASSSG